MLGSIGYYLSFLLDPLGFVGKRFAKYGDLYYAPAPDGGLYAVMHPDHLYEVLVSRAAQFDKTHTAFKRLGEVLGDGLLTSDGETWRRRRRMIQPAFSKERLAGYARGMVDEALRATSAMRDGEERDLDHDMMELTLRVVSRALFSHDAGGDTKVISEAMSAFQARLTGPAMVPGWIPDPGRRRVDRALAALDQMVYGLIAARKGKQVKSPSDLLDMLVTAIDTEGDGKGLTEREVRDELVTLFLAGHETTSNALAWTFHLLSTHREAERKLHEEIDALGGKPPSLADLERMPYGEMVLKEAMRMRPPVFMVARRAREATEIGGYPVPAGSEVVVWIYRTHHDPRWYPEPERFRPERFAPAEESKLPKLAYAPFGAGPRACIGKSFAMIEARLLLATLAQRFRFEPVSRAPVLQEPRITLGPKGGLRMRVKQRPPS